MQSTIKQFFSPKSKRQHKASLTPSHTETSSDHSTSSSAYSYTDQYLLLLRSKTESTACEPVQKSQHEIGSLSVGHGSKKECITLASVSDRSTQSLTCSIENGKQLNTQNHPAAENAHLELCDDSSRSQLAVCHLVSDEMCQQASDSSLSNCSTARRVEEMEPKRALESNDKPCSCACIQQCRETCEKLKQKIEKVKRALADKKKKDLIREVYSDQALFACERVPISKNYDRKFFRKSLEQMYDKKTVLKKSVYGKPNGIKDNEAISPLKHKAISELHRNRVRKSKTEIDARCEMQYINSLLQSTLSHYKRYIIKHAKHE